MKVEARDTGSFRIREERMSMMQPQKEASSWLSSPFPPPPPLPIFRIQSHQPCVHEKTHLPSALSPYFLSAAIYSQTAQQLLTSIFSKLICMVV